MEANDTASKLAPPTSTPSAAYRAENARQRRHGAGDHRKGRHEPLRRGQRPAGAATALLTQGWHDDRTRERVRERNRAADVIRSPRRQRRFPMSRFRTLLDPPTSVRTLHRNVYPRLPLGQFLPAGHQRLACLIQRLAASLDSLFRAFSPPGPFPAPLAG